MGTSRAQQLGWDPNIPGIFGCKPAQMDRLFQGPFAYNVIHPNSTGRGKNMRGKKLKGKDYA